VVDGGQLLDVSVACDRAADCRSGACVDGVCCEHACGAAEGCNLPGSAGRCVARPLGSACGAGADCPTGFCVQGVCCDQACDRGCQSCAVLGAAGHCVAAPDGTDPQGDCPYACSACYGGACGPAPLDTNPEGRCAEGLACGVDQVCHAPIGGSCDQDADCTAQTCVLGTCSRVEQFDVQPAGLSASANLRYVLASAVSPDGSLAVAMSEEQYGRGEDCSYGQLDALKDTDENALFVLERRAGAGGFTAQRVSHSLRRDCGFIPVAAAYLGQALYVAGAHLPDGTGYTCHTTDAPCGIFGWQRGVDGTESYESIDPSVARSSSVSLAVAPEGVVALTYDVIASDGSAHLLERERVPGVGWGAAVDLGAVSVPDLAFDNSPFIPLARHAVVFAGGRFWVAFQRDAADGTGDLYLWSEATGTQPVPIPRTTAGGCDLGIYGDTQAGASGDLLEVSVSCDSSVGPYERVLARVDVTTGAWTLSAFTSEDLSVPVEGNLRFDPLGAQPVDLGGRLAEVRALVNGSAPVQGLWVKVVADGQSQTLLATGEVYPTSTGNLTAVSAAASGTGWLVGAWSTNYELNPGSSGVLVANPVHVIAVQR
jgi:hypothetical protein